MASITDSRTSQLTSTEVRILKLLKAKALSEKKIARRTPIDRFVLSTILTDLMLKGYVETFRRRRLMLLRRQYFVITVEGIEALEANLHPVERILNGIGRAVASSVERLAGDSLAFSLAAWSVRRIAKPVRFL